MIAASDIARMREICDAASPGPFVLESDKTSTAIRGPGKKLVAFLGRGSNPTAPADALFWVAARKAIPVLLAEIERLQEGAA